MTTLEPLDLSPRRLAPVEVPYEPKQQVLPSRLYGRGEPTNPREVRKFEKAWHRNAAYHLANQMSIKDTAAACDVSPVCVSQLLKNPWFQGYVTELIAERGGGDIMELVKAELMNTFVTLVELRDNPKVSPTVKARICDSILDRGLGKALQRIEQTNVPTSNDPVAEAERLEKENARLMETN